MGPEHAFAIVLKQLRMEKGLTQEKLALDGDLDRTFISLLERGLRQPTLATMLTIAKVLDVSPVLLMEKVVQQLLADEK